MIKDLYVGDGGDYLNILGLTFFARHLKGEDVAFQYTCELRPLTGTYGRYRRFLKGWTYKLDRMSRDQMIPNVCLWKLIGYSSVTFNAYLLLRLGFMTNTRRNGATPQNHGKTHNYNWKLPDFSGPEFFGLVFRHWTTYPLIMIADLQTLVDCIIWRFFRKDDNNILNQTVILLFQKRYYPTPVSWLARKILPNSLIKRKFNAFVKKGEFPDFLCDLYGELIDEL